MLDDIPGIGKTRKRELLRAFGSLAQLRKADAAEIIARVPGIGRSMAEKIVEHL